MQECMSVMHAECKKRLRDDFSENWGLTCNFEKMGGLNAIFQNARFKMQIFMIAMHRTSFEIEL